MPIGLVLDLARNALTVAIMLAGPLLGVAMLVGLLVSLLQAVTSIQEQTLSFVPKLFAVAVTFILLLSWMLQTMMRFTTEVFLGIPGFVG
jgi:flagellar biosynthetic protein FliQ